MPDVKACTRMLWMPDESHSTSGSAMRGIVWVESINSLKETAVVRFDPGEGVRSRAYCARMSDLKPL